MMACTSVMGSKRYHDRLQLYHTAREHCDCAHKSAGQATSITHSRLPLLAEKIRECFFLKQSLVFRHSTWSAF